MVLRSRILPSDPGGMTPGAPVGSVSWAKRLRVELCVAVEHLSYEPKRVWGFLRILIEHKAWTMLNKQDGTTFKEFENFLATEPPWGLGTTVDEIQPYLEAALGRNKAQLALIVPSNQGQRNDLGTSRPVGGKLTFASERTQARLRAVLRAPKAVQRLYEQNLIALRLASKLGPIRATPKHRKRIEQIAKKIESLTSQEEVNRVVYKMLGIKSGSSR